MDYRGPIPSLVEEVWSIRNSILTAIFRPFATPTASSLAHSIQYLMVLETRVHGGSSVWRSIKTAFPFGQSPAPTHPSGSAAALDSQRPEYTPCAQLLSRLSTEQGQEASSQEANSVAEREGAMVDSAPQNPSTPDFGYSRDHERRYRIKNEIARGGNGIVTLVVDIRTGQEYAMKSLPKILDDPNVSERKRLEHQASIKREVDVMRRLRGCLNVASLEEVYEDDTHVHIVMEYCSGGELYHRIGSAHYSERTVASFMRATLRTLAQCHANKILHRDIKPGNFLLSSDDERAPLKAVDFGLATFYDEKQLPRTDLGLEGTPWFMSPESLRSEVFPASDIWSAGVMCVQLLTGRFPFDDKSNPHNPALSKVWKSILSDEIDFSKSHWRGISDDAKDFVKRLLNKDPRQRPTAKEALKHRWLLGRIEERSSGRPLSLAVVQRIQRFSQASVFKRSVLELIAEELLADEEKTPKDESTVCPLSADARPLIIDPSADPLEYLYERLRLVDHSLVDRTVLADGLKEMGYRLTQAEVDRLLDQLDTAHTGHVAKSQLAASQIDWGALQESQTERWLRCARRAFADLDADKDGVVSTEDMIALLRHKLPPAEVETAVRHALAEAARRRVGDPSSHGGSSAGDTTHGGSNGLSSPEKKSRPLSQSSQDPSQRNGLNFRQFLRMLNVGSADSLDLYDERIGSPGSFDHGSRPASLDGIDMLLNQSVKGGNAYPRAPQLEPVIEEIQNS